MQKFCERLKQGSEKIAVDITDEQISLMAAHGAELIRWNKKINLTAIVDPLAMAEKHFIDALAVQRFLGQEKRVMDMGTGGGFPSIPLKILNPSIGFVLVDASRKKVNFLKHVIRTLGLKNIDAVHSRVEDLACDVSHASTYDAVMSRAFTGLEKFVEFALPMLKPEGKIYALKGKQAPDEITADLKSQFEIRTDHYQLPFEKSDRYMIQLKKITSFC
ncbi:MAG: 16S rRNA (guanine(527)-N(7))-methyltransferase RsmG [Desulfobacteraceae bacterium]|nr:16S rRNA (guanine(527)-N(7))-methyltransferase RsmG [Desulfobacteraceae bacterium]